MPLDSSTLLTVGACLVMAGIFLRGFASSTRRDLARRKQHDQDTRRTHEASLSDEFERPPGWFERNLGLIANGVLVLGLLLAITGCVRG